MPRDGFHRVAAARLLLHAGPGPALDERNLSQDRMLDLDRIERAPAPGRQIFRRAGGHSPRRLRSRQQFVVVRIFFRQPAFRAVQQNILQPHRTHLPRISLPTQTFIRFCGVGWGTAQLRFEQATAAIRGSKSAAIVGAAEEASMRPSQPRISSAACFARAEGFDA